MFNYKAWMERIQDALYLDNTLGKYDPEENVGRYLARLNECPICDEDHICPELINKALNKEMG